MNRLVKFLEEHHGTKSTAFEFTRTEVIMEETGWTREEIFHMAREAKESGDLVAHYSGSDCNRWSYDEMLPEDLVTIGTIGSCWKPHHKKVLFKQKTSF